MNTPPSNRTQRFHPEDEPIIDRYPRNRNDQTIEMSAINLEDAFEEVEVEEEKPQVDTGLVIAKPIFALPCGVNLDNCPICMEEMNMVNITVTTCGHTFHSHCAFNALMNNTDCPMCRHQLIEYPEQENESDSGSDSDSNSYSDSDDEDDDNEEEEYDSNVSLEKVSDKLKYMGYDMADLLRYLIIDNIPTEKRERYTEDHADTMFTNIADILSGSISLSSRDNRSYSSVLSGKNTLIDTQPKVKITERLGERVEDSVTL